jgi:transmembrane sensor
MSDKAVNETTREVRAAAAQWRERRDGSEWGAEDQAALNVWLAQSPAHKIAYLRVDHVWARADRLSALRAPSTTERPRIPSTVARVAAAFVLAAIAGGAWFTLNPQQSNERVYATGIGGRETLKLADGSQIELNTGTTVRVSADTHQRRVTLEKGEAFFQIMHNAERPFVVVAGDHRVVDLGTKFMVRRDPGRFEVALVEGRARLEAVNGKAAAPARDLVPGDVVIATANTVYSEKKAAQTLVNELGWRRGVLVFRDTALADVAEELNRYNTQKIVIADPEVARLTIGATIPTHGVEAFTRVAKDVFGLHIQNRNGEIVISR